MTVRLFPAVAASLLALSFQAQAQDRLLARYVADLGPEDRYTSTGARHMSFAGLIAQDRANYHRFGIRHGNDEGDPIFSDRAMRAQIGAQTVQIPDYYAQYVRNILTDESISGTYTVISVFGQGDTISRITFEVPG
ncbi:hypothetical protein [Palleronia pelagia]|uniref:Uncharacterized protein n=1 Tax=Palleronia pelagia TaxID=387096 RepID=A0A1H8FT52_9RHOB|nr:hypothetical protein [Palleronia pelagia]SEN34730.1 hypothetical protein SAMN04488011_103453 [Palleronia pelagia]